VVLVKNKLESRFPCLKVKRGEVEIYDGPQKRPKDGVRIDPAGYMLNRMELMDILKQRYCCDKS
jgi:hypothetical protein